MPTRCGVLVLVLLSGCLHTTQQFAFDTEPVALKAATEEAAAKLGWSLRAAESGHFTLVDAPRGPVEVRVNAGKLTLSGNRPSMVAPMFAALTRQELLHTEGEVPTLPGAAQLVG